MGEITHERFLELFEEQIDIKSFSWANVHYLLLKHEGIEDIQFEDVVMACGEGFAFAYSPYHYAPMYLSLMGSGERLRDLFGYSIVSQKGPMVGGDIEQAWEFIITYLEKGVGIHVEGSESFLIYGYNDPGLTENRSLKCLGKWGPGLDGEVTWEQFSTFPIFSVSTIVKTNPPLSMEENTKRLVKTIHKYQTKHPGIGKKFKVSDEVKIQEMQGKEFTLKAKNFGINGFETFLDHVQNDQMIQGMLQAYLYGHAINFQIWGRKAQSKWFADRSEKYRGKEARLLYRIADAYDDAAKELQEFVKTNEDNKEDGRLYSRIRRSLDDLKKAFKHERRAVEAIAELVEEFNEEPATLEEVVKESLFAGMGGGAAHIDPFTVIADLKIDNIEEKPADNVMSLWEQLEHFQFWQELIIKNIKEGKPSWDNVDWTKYPPDFISIYGNFEGFKKAILDSILEIQQIITNAEDLTKQFPDVYDFSVVHLVRILSSHMSYHIAQIVQTRKLLGLWPPLGYYTRY